MLLYLKLSSRLLHILENCVLVLKVTIFGKELGSRVFRSFSIANVVGFPRSVCVDGKKNRLYIADHEKCEIRAFNYNGNGSVILRGWDTASRDSSRRYPIGIFKNCCGHLMVVYNHNQQLKIGVMNQNGQFLYDFQTGFILRGVIDVAVNSRGLVVASGNANPKNPKDYVMLVTRFRRPYAFPCHCTGQLIY